MTYLVATDEAGYGPNLGPLVISASVWEVPDGVGSGDLYRLLEPAVAPRPDGRRRVAMADSKILYSSGKGLALLERGLWAAWGLLGLRPRTCAEVWDVLADGSIQARRMAASEDCEAMPLPRDADLAEYETLQPILRQTMAAAGVRLLGLRSRAIFPDEFNRTIAKCGSKGLALSRWTLGLVERTIRPLRTAAVSILCDKHGGRDRYLPLLMECFEGEMIVFRAEGRLQSIYRFGPPQCPVEFCFQAKAESHLPAALASMASKYLRELAMHALNAFWTARLPGLRPTAGYPQDALRFKAEIAATQRLLKIDDQILWRVK